MPSAGIRIGAAAARLGVASHVLRHWEDAGLLRPPRLGSGHRSYGEEELARARVIQIGQRAGLSLAEIGQLASAGQAERIAQIDAKRAQIAQRMAYLELADRFLAHVITCVHPIISECPQCSSLVQESSRAEPEPFAHT